MKRSKLAKSLAVLTAFATMMAFTACGGTETSQEADIHMSMSDDVSALVDAVDTEFAWDVTKTLSYDEKYWDSETGFRTAGSDAEHKTADYLAGVFQDIGLQDVTKEEVSVDKWQFNGSKFTIKNDAADIDLTITPSSYASTGTDADGVTGEVVYLKHGYTADYENYYDKHGLKGGDRNMNGKIVLIDINQDEEYWIDSHYDEAYFQGAAGLMSYSSQYVDENGKQRGDKWDTAAQIQDLCSADHKLPCVTISSADGLEIKNAIKKIDEAGETAEATLMVDNEVVDDGGTGYNVTGVIKGAENTGQRILVAGHYDKYWFGTNDDCAAIGLVATLAKSMVDSGYKPKNDIVFIAHCAEEWGVEGTSLDWAEGSWQMITKAHPEWRGSTLGILNYELPAKEGTEGTLSASIDSTEETYGVQKALVSDSGLVSLLGQECPITQEYKSQPMSDAICYQFNGVPCYQINAVAGSEGNELSTYHTMYDDEDEYSDEAMDYAVKLSGALAMYIDQSPALRLGFGLRCKQLEKSIDGNAKLYEKAGVDVEAYKAAIADLKAAGTAYTAKAEELNTAYEEAVAAGEDTSAIWKEASALNKEGLKAYQVLQDTLLSFGGEGDVHIGHKVVADNIKALNATIKALQNGDMDGFFDNAWQINGGLEYNAYSFGTDTCAEILKCVECEYVKDNRLYGKNAGNVATYKATCAVVNETASEGFEEEISIYNGAKTDLIKELKDLTDKEIEGMNKMTKILEDK